ncbi:hypothetical protein HAX54_030010, partial [Datura stramonium]|nr:hypothetical protein [Datura stramonium]
MWVATHEPPVKPILRAEIWAHVVVTYAWNSEMPVTTSGCKSNAGGGAGLRFQVAAQHPRFTCALRFMTGEML